MDHEKTVEQLEHLIHVNRTSEAGFCTAAEEVKNSELETLFGGYAKQHAKFANELREEVNRLGGHVAATEGSAGAIERGWMNLKAALSGHSPGALLGSCESGEESAERAYRDVADANPTGQTHSLLEKHYKQVQEFRTRLARLAGEVKDGAEFQINE